MKLSGSKLFKLPNEELKLVNIGNKMRVLKASITNVWSKIKQMRVIFNRLRLWIAVARHNFKGLEIQKNCK